MTLPVNFIVYGKVKRGNTSPINGATVRIISNTNPQGTATGNTDSSGKYLINVKNYANDSDSMAVSCTFQRESKTETFSLSIATGTKEINLNLEVTQTVTHGHSGRGPGVYITCGQCGYNNYYPYPSDTYCCHVCLEAIHDKENAPC